MCQEAVAFVKKYGRSSIVGRRRMFYLGFGFALQAMGHTQSLPREGARRELEKLMEEQIKGWKQLKLQL